MFVDEKTIDRVNIYQATINGMYNAIFALDPQPQQVLIDAVPLDRLPMALELDREIPAELYTTVAEVLAYVYRIDKRKEPREKGPRL